MQTAKFGGNGGNKYVIETKGKKICGVKGKSSNHINQICFGISHWSSMAIFIGILSITVFWIFENRLIWLEISINTGKKITILVRTDACESQAVLFQLWTWLTCLDGCPKFLRFSWSETYLPCLCKLFQPFWLLERESPFWTSCYWVHQNRIFSFLWSNDFRSPLCYY